MNSERERKISRELDTIHALALAVGKSLEIDDFDTAIDTLRRRDDRMNELRRHVMEMDTPVLQSLMQGSKLGEMVKKIQKLDEENLAALQSRTQDAYDNIRELEKDRQTIKATRKFGSAGKKRIVDFFH